MTVSGECKDWLAEVGAERLREAQDPDMSYKRVIVNTYLSYRREGLSCADAEAKVRKDIEEARAEAVGNVVDITSKLSAARDAKMLSTLTALLGPLA